MDSRKFILRQTLIVSVGQAVGIGLMLAVFALLNRFDRSVWLGGIFGGIIAIGNFFVMAVCADLAADKAEKMALLESQLQDATQCICDIYRKKRRANFYCFI